MTDDNPCFHLIVYLLTRSRLEIQGKKIIKSMHLKQQRGLTGNYVCVHVLLSVWWVIWCLPALRYK